MRISRWRVLVACGAVAAVSSLTACGSDGSGSSASTAAQGGGGASSSSGGGGGGGGGGSISLMIASSGPAELNAVTAASKAFAGQSGTKVNVINTSNLAQQLTQAFAGGSPPDVFYGTPAQFESLAKTGSMAQTGDKVADSSDFYPALKQAFTYQNKFYCVPKDFSTLALEINNSLWQQAGLTTKDIPTTWAQLETVAKKLTKGKVTGLVVGDTLDRVGAFMAQAGGTYMNSDKSKFTFDSPQNVAGLSFVQKLAKEGVLKFPKQVGAGWGGEAFGKGLAAMTMEGNWIVGAMQSDYKNVKYTIAPLPAGPGGKKGTLTFTNCWGVASKSKNQAAAIKLVDYLTTPTQQIAFAKAFGVMPSRQAAKAGFVSALPQQKPFVDAAAYGVPQVTTVGFNQVQTAFDSQIINLASGDPKALLTTLQNNAQALLK